MSRSKAFPLKENFYKDIEPLTKNQRRAFESFRAGKNLVLKGYAGTGKTFSAMFLALEACYNPDNAANNIIIVRSAQASQDIGFLPGTYEEKMAVYEEPYDCLTDQMYKTFGNYTELKTRGGITFMSASFIRGITFDNAIIIVDECQNLNYSQLYSVITRVGQGSQIIFSGDYAQSDLRNTRDKSGILKFNKILDGMGMFDTIQFDVDDIVRSEFVKQFLIHEQLYVDYVEDK